MKMFSIGLVGLSLLACGAKPGDDGEDTGNAVADADNDGFDASVDCDDSDADINPDADEICDGLDNNCDDEIDEATATDAGTWYADSDLDSYGDANTSMIACDMPEGYVEDGTDCDDTSELVNPAAAEVCDGIDNDCDASTSEDNMATHISTDGVASDVTADVSGADGAPAEFTVSDGALHFCDGTFYVNLMVDGDATVGSLNEDPTQAILDGGGIGRPVLVWGEALTVGLADLTLQNGFAPEDGMNPMFDSAGGGVHCSANMEASELVANDMSMDNVMITGNSAQTGGGMFSLGCDLTISNSEIASNNGEFGAGFISFEGNHSWMAVDIVDNESVGYSAGGFASGMFSPDTYTVMLDDVVVTGNVNLEGDEGGVLAFVGSTAATWTGTAGAEGSGVWGNTSPGSGSLELIDGGQLVADTVDFGSAEAGTGNSDFDVSYDGPQGEADYWVARDDASFSCDEFGCGTPVTSIVADSVDYNSGNGMFFGAVIQASSTSTLMSFEMDSSEAASDCSMDFYLLKEMSSGFWEVLWSNTDVSLNTSGNTNSGMIGVVVEDGERYVTGFKGACTSGMSNDDIGYDDSGSGSMDAGWGTAIGSVAGDIEAQNISLSDFGDGFNIFYMEFNHTQL
jgi:hypothetical protein